MDTEEVRGDEGEPCNKAVKSDDAKIPIHLWNDRITQKLMEH